MVALPRGQIFSSPIETILQWMCDQSRSKTLNELQSCGEQEVERVARDSGLSVAEFRVLACLGPNATDLLERRMAALGLDPIAVSTARRRHSAIFSAFALSVRARGGVCETLRAIPPSQPGRIIARTPKR